MKPIMIFITCLFLVNSNIVVSQEFPTRGEVYDYDIGDVFHRKLTHTEGTPNGNGTETVFRNSLLTDKYFTENNDSLCYELFIERLEFNDWSSEEIHTEYSIVSCFINLENVLEGDTAYENSAWYHGRNTVYYFNMIVEGPNEQTNSFRKTIGLGNTYTYSKNWSWATLYKTEYINELVYYKKGDEEWGEEQIILGLDEEAQPNHFTVYPNPIHNQLNIKSDFNKEYEIHIYNSIGQLIERVANSSSQLTVEVEHFLSGIYIAHIVGNDGFTIEKRRFVKN